MKTFAIELSRHDAHCRNADTLKKLQQTQKQLKEQQQSAYVDLGKSEEERKLGNEVRRKSGALPQTASPILMLASTYVTMLAAVMHQGNG